MLPKDADGMTKSVDPDQAAPLFTQTCLSENLESLPYISEAYLLCTLSK